jgi:hypothetical protein
VNLKISGQWRVTVVVGVLLVLVAAGTFFLFRQDDLGLKQVAGVADVQVPVRPLWASRHLIHLVDYPFVPRTRYEGTAPYEKFLTDVEAVQQEEVAVLRWIVARFQLRAVSVAGLSRDRVPEFHATVAEVGARERSDVPELRKQLARLSGQKSEQERTAAQDLEKRLQWQREMLLGVGAVGRLIIAEQLSEARPLENPKAPADIEWQKADQATRTARDDVMARNALVGGEPVVVVVLGAGHDLAAGVRAHDPRCAYLRVTTRKFAELFGGR